MTGDFWTGLGRDAVKNQRSGLINNMESENQTGEADFLPLGLSEDPELQPFLFELFLAMYLGGHRAGEPAHDPGRQHWLPSEHA